MILKLGNTDDGIEDLKTVWLFNYDEDSSESDHRSLTRSLEIIIVMKCNPESLEQSDSALDCLRYLITYSKFAWKT